MDSSPKSGIRGTKASMRIEDSKGNQLTCLDDWRGLQVPDKWKPGRSAHSIADFVVNRQGASSLRDRVSSVLGEPVEFLKLVPEYEVRFDRYGRGRVHDLGIFGDTVSGRAFSSESKRRSTNASTSTSAMPGEKLIKKETEEKSHTNLRGYRSCARGSVTGLGSPRTQRFATSFSMVRLEPLTLERMYRCSTWRYS